jgi:acetylornithine deacetylase/succinyl-diaminopimelate desuccinylase-like protein
VICLDAECGNFDQVWCTTSLRGNLIGKLHVRVLSEGVHSGMATGIAPTPFRIVEQLMARLESAITGDILLDELQVTIPKDRRVQIQAAAAVLGDTVAGKLPFAPGVKPLSNDPVELLINSTWRATVAVTGADGLPPTGSAGNVLLPELSFKLSFRLAPTTDAARAVTAVKEALERDPPYGAEVQFKDVNGAGGWNAPAFAPWLDESIMRASREVYGKDAVYLGCGGLGPHSNAHGPNEFLHIEYAKKLTTCVSLVLADHAKTM